MVKSRSVEEQKRSCEQRIADLKAVIADPGVDPSIKKQYVKLLENAIENLQIRELYAVFETYSHPGLAVAADRLVNDFRRHYRSLAGQPGEKEPIGTPYEFNEWLSSRAVFSGSRLDPVETV